MTATASLPPLIKPTLLLTIPPMMGSHLTINHSSSNPINVSPCQGPQLALPQYSPITHHSCVSLLSSHLHPNPSARDLTATKYVLAAWLSGRPVPVLGETERPNSNNHLCLSCIPRDQIVTTICLSCVLCPFHVLSHATHTSIFIAAVIPSCDVVAPKEVSQHQWNGNPRPQCYNKYQWLSQGWGL
jgi:hypothetical protein